MKRILALFLLCRALPAATDKIPSLRARSFSDAQVNLPGDLHGKAGVLVLGFSKNSSEQTRGWNEALLKDYGADSGVAYYQCAVLAEVPSLIRGFVIRSIRGGMPPSERAHFVPIVQQEKEWKEAAGYDAPDDAYILIVNAAGLVKWRFHGPETPDNYKAFKGHLAEQR